MIGYELVDPKDKHLAGHPGAILYWQDPKTKRLIGAYIKTDRTLDADDMARAQAHETGHAVDMIALEIPFDGIEDELRLVYSVLRTGKLSPKPIKGPEDFGYPTDQVRDELMAEGIRAYMRHPNWFKKHAPNAAKRIREKVNLNTDINDVLQFNSLTGTGLGAGIGAGALVGGEENGGDPRL